MKTEVKDSRRKGRNGASNCRSKDELSQNHPGEGLVLPPQGVNSQANKYFMRALVFWFFKISNISYFFIFIILIYLLTNNDVS